MPKKSTAINFEKTLAELEQLVETMEKGDLSLEESLQYFERGIFQGCGKSAEIWEGLEGRSEVDQSE